MQGHAGPARGRTDGVGPAALGACQQPHVAGSRSGRDDGQQDVRRRLEVMAHGLFRHDRGNYKYLNALERAAERAGRLDELCLLYEELAPEDKRFYGRLRRIRGRRPG